MNRSYGKIFKNMKERIGIFGCTADPFTLAHREIVKQALAQRVVDAVVIVPTIVDWHRAGKSAWLDSEQKISVIKAMTKGLGLVYVDDTELKRKEMCAESEALTEHIVKNWRFIDTLMRIKLDKADDKREFWPIIGTDSLAGFKAWFAWKDILAQSSGIIAVNGRAGVDFDEKSFMAENPEFEGKLRTIRIDAKFANVSASAARIEYASRPDGVGEYLKNALDEIEKSEKTKNIILHTPIFDVVKGEKAKTGLEPILVDAPDWIMIIAEKAGKFLVERQFRYGAARDIGEFPCGMVESGENPLDAAVRELEEETGIRISDKNKVLKLGSTNPNPAFMTNTMHYFYVNLDNAGFAQVDRRLDEHERIVFGWKDKNRFMFDLADDAHCDDGRQVPAMALAAVKLYENASNYPCGG